MSILPILVEYEETAREPSRDAVWSTATLIQFVGGDKEVKGVLVKGKYIFSRYISKIRFIDNIEDIV